MFDRCPDCTSNFCAIPIDGPDDAEILCLGERPGQDEERAARQILDKRIILEEHLCFIGQAGKEFNENYLSLAHLSRDVVRVGNVVRCGKEQNRKPTTQEVSQCVRHFLPAELDRHRYSVIVLMGATACSLWPQLRLEVEHGVPQWMDIEDSILSGCGCDWSGWVIPIYHPAAGLHDTGMMTPMLEDWTKVGKWLTTGEWQWPTDEYPDPDYGLLETIQDWETYLHCYAASWIDWLYIGGDTESDNGQPYSIQITLTPGTGRMILLENQQLVHDIGMWLDNELEFKAVLALHYAPADLEIFQSVIGNDLAGHFVDTMQQAYHFGNLPQGLKELSYRQFGVRMQSWEDLVMPHSKDVLSNWLSDRIMEEADRPILTNKQLKTKVKIIKKPNDREKLYTRVFNHMMKSAEYDPWERLTDIEGVPKPGIRHVPIEEQVRYACADADMTLRHALKFEAMMRSITTEGGEWYVPEEDWDR